MLSLKPLYALNLPGMYLHGAGAFPYLKIYFLTLKFV
nr:MAG TPA: hypothetical protein [Caudoviricetes sp.]